MIDFVSVKRTILYKEMIYEKVLITIQSFNWFLHKDRT